MSSIQSHPDSPPSTTTNTTSPSNPSATSTTTPLHPHPDADQPHPQPSKETHEAKAAFTATLHSVSQTHETAFRDRARTLHTNAAALSKQEEDLQRATRDLRRQNDGWARTADVARQGLKEIGDVQNWAELIERDLLVVEEAVRLAEEREMEEAEREERERVRGEEGRGDGVGDADGDVDGEGGRGGGGVVDGKGKGEEGTGAGGKKKGWLWW